jgi:hypothetical protein
MCEMNRNPELRQSSNETGVTLLELLVAITLIAVMAVGVWAALELCINTWSRGIVTIDVNLRERNTQDMVRRQIASAYPVIPIPVRPSVAGMQNTVIPISTAAVPVFSGGETSLRFVSPNSLQSLDSMGLVLVSYEAEVDSDGNIAIVAREAPYTGQNVNDGEFVSAMPVFWNLRESRFEYYDAGDANNPAEWFTEWDTANRRRLPAAVRISMVYQDSDSDSPGLQMIIPLQAQYNFLQVQTTQLGNRRQPKPSQRPKPSQQQPKPKAKAGF